MMLIVVIFSAKNEFLKHAVFGESSFLESLK